MQKDKQIKKPDKGSKENLDELEMIIKKNDLQSKVMKKLLEKMSKKR